jgi:biopolymer transport protein ExbD
MNLGRHRRHHEIPTASLADMAFLLLIFFIATTTFAVEFGLPLVLPSARQRAVLSVRPEDVFRIEARADGTFSANGREVGVADIAPLLRAGNEARRAARREELVVLIETHPRAPYASMMGVLDEVRRADARRIALKQLESAP